MKRIAACTMIGVCAVLSACASPGDIRRSADERQAVHKELEARVAASEPRCSTPESCAAVWEAAKHWAQFYEGRIGYFDKATRISIVTNNWGLDIRLVPDGSARVLRAEKTCMFAPCYNAAAAAILDLNATVAKATQ